MLLDGLNVLSALGNITEVTSSEESNQDSKSNFTTFFLGNGKIFNFGVVRSFVLHGGESSSTKASKSKSSHLF